MTVAFSNSARSQQFVRMQLSSTCETLETAVAEVCFIDSDREVYGNHSVFVIGQYECTALQGFEAKTC